MIRIRRKKEKRKSSKTFFNKLKRVIFHFIIISIAFFVQTSIFPLIPFFSCSPNLLLIITFSYGLIYGEQIGIIIGIFCGLLCDMYFIGEFGFYILIYSVIGFINGTLKNSFFEDSISLPMMLCVINGFIYNFYIYFTHFFVRKKFEIIIYIVKIMFPSVLFSLIVTVIIYKLLYKLNILRKI